MFTLKVEMCSSEEELSNLKTQVGDWIAGCGIPAIYSATMDSLPLIQQQIVAHFLYHR